MLRTALLLTASLVLIAGCGGHTIQGSIELHSAEGVQELPTSSSCAGADGYDDMAAAAPVVVRDGAGKVIGTAALDPGVPDKQFPHVSCHFTFSVAVSDTDFYQPTIGRRDPVTYSRQDLERQDWKPHLTLGD